MMIEVDGVYRTSDMLLTGVLYMHGYDYKMERVGRQKVVWYFDPEADKLEGFKDLVERYSQMACRLEPHELMRAISFVRVELYAELGENAPRAKEKHRTTPSS